MRPMAGIERPGAILVTPALQCIASCAGEHKICPYTPMIMDHTLPQWIVALPRSIHALNRDPRQAECAVVAEDHVPTRVKSVDLEWAVPAFIGAIES